MLRLINKGLRPKHLLLVVLVFTILATTAFLMPGTSIPSIRIKTPIAIDKLVHFGIHFILVFFWLVYYARSSSKVKLRNVLYIAVSCILYGILIELLQGVTETRSSDLYDVFANMIGTTLGVLVFLVLKSKIEIKS